MILFLFAIFLNTVLANSFCDYSYTVWNHVQKKSEGPFHMKKAFSSLTPTERGEGGCSLCKNDQRKITLSNGVSFEVCKTEASKIQSVLEAAMKDGVTIKSVVGYRPSMSKGPLDGTGRRTLFSRHAYGLAIDVNEDFNGLYDHCLNWGPSCRLLKGGTYAPKHPLALTSESVLVKLFKSSGFKWGGEIQGQQKDFMHFSPDGL